MIYKKFCTFLRTYCKKFYKTSCTVVFYSLLSRHNCVYSGYRKVRMCPELKTCLILPLETCYCFS